MTKTLLRLLFLTVPAVALAVANCGASTTATEPTAIKAIDYGEIRFNDPGAAAMNTATLQAALRVANSRCAIVKLPVAGIIYINDGLEISADCRELSAGLEGDGGKAFLKWQGPQSGFVVRLGSGRTVLRDIRIHGGNSPGYPKANSVIGVWMYDEYFNHVQNQFTNVQIEHFDIGMKVERPNVMRGGQAEGAQFSSVWFRDNRIGIHLGHSNIDYWTFISTYWEANQIGIECGYLENTLCNANNFTFIGNVATGTNRSGERWIVLHNAASPNAWTFQACQTEQIEYNFEVQGLTNLVFIGGNPAPLKTDNFAGKIVSIGAWWNKREGWVSGIDIERGHVTLLSLGDTYYLNGVRKWGGATEWIAAGGVTKNMRAEPQSSGYATRDYVHLRQFGDGQVDRTNSALEIALTYANRAATAFRVQGPNNTDPRFRVAEFYRGTDDALTFSIDYDGAPVVTTSGNRPGCSARNRGKLWHSANAPTVKDEVAICAKAADDTYAWRTLY